MKNENSALIEWTAVNCTSDTYPPQRKEHHQFRGYSGTYYSLGTDTLPRTFEKLEAYGMLKLTLHAEY